MEYKKRYNLFLKLIFGVLVLLSAYFVFAGLDTSNTTAVTNSTVQTNLTSGTGIHTSERMLINISIVHDGAEDNITNFTVDLPAGNYTFIGFANLSSDHLEEDQRGNETDPMLSNVTYFGANPTAQDTISWDCINTSVTSITCNTTEDKEPLGPDLNTTLKFAILVSAIGSIEEPSNVWNVSTNHSASGVNSTTFNLMVDSLVPRISEINITDGNTTLYNGTSLGDTFVLDSESDITVYATVTDMLHSNVVLYYINNNTDVMFEDHGNYTSYAVMNVTAGAGEDSRVYSATITSAHLIDQNITTFIIVANDTSNQQFVLNDTSSIHNETMEARDLRSFAININSSVPHVRDINITDSINTKTKPVGGSGDYLRGRLNYTVEVEVNGHEDAVMLLWSYTNTTQINISGDGAYLLTEYTLGPGTNITYMENITAKSDQGYVVWNGSIDIEDGINDTAVITFAILVNATDLASNTTGAELNSSYHKIIPIADGSDSFNFTVDDSLPSVSITAPSDTTIEVTDSITYSCSATDDLSGVSATYTWTLTKPAGGTVTKTGSSVTFTNTDTDKAGTYTVDCSVDDNVGNKGSATSVTFNALYTTAGVAAAGSSGGGARTVTVPAETEVDAGVITSEGVNTLISTGGTATFTVAGASHSAKVISIGVDEVTIEISSDPLTVTLKVGETKEVDINADGKNDLSVTLNRIVDEQADLTFTEIIEKVGVGEVPEEAPEAVGEVPEIAEKPSRVGLIITIIVIILVLIIGYFIIKRKK